MLLQRSAPRVMLGCLLAVLIITPAIEAKRSDLGLGEANVPTMIYDSGQNIKYYHAPYVMQLRKADGTVICDGTLISPTHVLTAAHCFDDYDSKDISVVGGATKKSDTGIQRNIDQLFKHDKYNPKNLDNDVAVLKLATAMEGDKIHPFTKLCNDSMTYYQFIQLSGWLRPTVTGPWAHNEQLRTNRFPILPQTECLRDTPDSDTEVTSSMFCSYTLSRDACMHNAGGPAISQGQLCGIVLGGSGCAEQEFPGVYTSVYAVRDFIKKSMKA